MILRSSKGDNAIADPSLAGGGFSDQLPLLAPIT